MSPRRPGIELPDFALLEGVVSDRILDAARSASKALTKAGIRHALIGGLAVGSYGYVRATKDVDFLVGDEAYVHQGGGVVTLAPGAPFAVQDIPVDLLSDKAVDHEVSRPLESGGIPIVSAEALVYLKLRAHRRRDKDDVVELLKAGTISDGSVRDYLGEIAPELTERFDALVALADDD